VLGGHDDEHCDVPGVGAVNVGRIRFTCWTRTARKTRSISVIDFARLRGRTRRASCREVLLGIGGVRVLRALGLSRPCIT